MSKKRRQPVEQPVSEEDVVFVKMKGSDGTVQKPLPEGYVCNICGSSGHAIYNCPSKLSKRQRQSKDESKNRNKSVGSTDTPLSTRQAEESIAEESDEHLAKAQEKVRRRVYMSGLPFDTDVQKLTDYLESEGCEIDFIKLVSFEDNPKKCKGIAFVTFKREQCVPIALQLSGRVYGNKTLRVERIKDSSKEKETTQGSKSSKSSSMKEKTKGPRCYRCGAQHDPSTCRNQRICYRCKSFDHISSQCPLKKSVS